MHAPIAAGFLQFLDAPMVKTHLARHLQEELREGKTDPLDSHPSLTERLQAIGALDEKHTMFSLDADERAIDLIDDVPALERQLIGAKLAIDRG